MNLLIISKWSSNRWSWVRRLLAATDQQMPSPKDVEVNAIDILNCWDETLRTNNRNALGQHWAPDFAFQMLGQNAMEQTSDEHLDWCTSVESPQIDNIDVRYDSGGICSGVHLATMVDGSVFDVMFFGRYDDSRIEHWSVLLSPRAWLMQRLRFFERFNQLDRHNRCCHW